MTTRPAFAFGAPRRRRAQSGAALLVAMILVTVVTTLAAGMVWQQWRAVEVEAAERARSQSAWILNGALDWARLILREDTRTSQVDHLGEPWAVPLAEARLSTFLAAERSANADDGPEAFLSGDITDAQARYNLRNLIRTTEQGKLEVDPKQRLVLQKLFTVASLSSGLADQLAGQLLLAMAEVPDAQAPLMPRSLDQMTWLGLDEATLAKLAPLVVVLPVPGTKVNLNTAPREVLAAVVQGLDLGSAQRLVQRREQQPFRAVAEATALFSSTPPPDFSFTDVKSDYFEVRGRLRLGDQVLEERSLVRRVQNEVVVQRRERVSAITAPPGTAAPAR
ncbi:type II secretion system minor pseudopilin GspK [Azohydromonas aeria]|uniref:type II secretion system minor pseudopilin GspK n=1 Tax=Azohydromonas aeria TaxID=2590212 RepID=UPI0012F89055|nr:type II secretion system minor pseudopilin GspK [Azohydromonas aeria]